MARSHIGPSKGIDATTALSVYIVLLLSVPSAMVIPALGSAGAPSTVLAMVLFLWWAWFHVQRTEPLEMGFQPVRWAMLGLLLIIMVVYVDAMSSPIPWDEVSPADSGLLRLLGMAGVLLVANDGILSLTRARAVMVMLVVMGGLVSLLGVTQFLTQQLFIDRISIPGLTAATADWGLGSRGGLARIQGTSTHPIEFGVLLGMVLPLAVTFAMHSPTRRWLYRGILILVGVALFTSISRSAMVCAGVALVVLALSWPMKVRLMGLAWTLAMAVGLFLVVPGLVGTIVRLFTGISEDTSVASRTDSYGIAWHFIASDPLLGRGFGTFLPKYWILDNGYLGLTIEAGFVGLIGLLILIGSGLLAARRASRLAAHDFDRSLAWGLLAANAAGASGLAFFDTFAFPQSAGCFFLVVGLAGAMLRLTRAEAAVRSGGLVRAGR